MSDSILKIEKVNEDSSGEPRALLGFAISAKRYALYERERDDVRIIDPKAHGLGYLYPPKDALAEQDTPPYMWAQPPWTLEAWAWIIRHELDLNPKPPTWLHLPAMMRVVLSTPFVLERLNRRTRPYNFLFCPLIDVTVGYPQGVDRPRFTLIAPFTKDRDAWPTLPCIDVVDGTEYELSLAHDTRPSKVIPQTYGYVLHLYPYREESKSLAPDGSPCRRPHARRASTRIRHGRTAALCRQRNRSAVGVRRRSECCEIEIDGVPTPNDSRGREATRRSRGSGCAGIDARDALKPTYS